MPENILAAGIGVGLTKRVSEERKSAEGATGQRGTKTKEGGDMSLDLELTLPDYKVAPQGGYVSKRCARRAHNDNDPNLEGLEVEPTEADKRRMEDGVLFEARIGAVWAEKLDMVAMTDELNLEGVQAVCIPDREHDERGREPMESKEKRERLTMKAIDFGVPVIWNARLQTSLETSRVSEPDALVRVGRKPTARNGWAYAPVDVKHHRSLAGEKRNVQIRVSELINPSFGSSVGMTVTGTPRMDDSMQLAHYHRHLEELGYAQTSENVWGGVIGKEERVYWRDLASPEHSHFFASTREKTSENSVLDIYDAEFAYRLEVISRTMAIKQDPTLEPLAIAEWKDECKICPWRMVCKKELSDAKHVTLVNGVTPEKASIHYRVGVFSYEDLANLYSREAMLVDAAREAKIDISFLKEASINREKTEDVSMLIPVAFPSGKRVTAVTRAKLEAMLREHGVNTVADVRELDELTMRYAHTGVSKLTHSIDSARALSSRRVFLRRDVKKIEIPRADIELDIDMENDPGGLIYMWGTRLTVRTERLTVPGVHPQGAYRPYCTWGRDDHEGEMQAFSDMWRLVVTMRGLASFSGVSFRAYCYSGAEERCMKTLARKYEGQSGIPTLSELEDFFRSDEWVDMERLVKAQTLWPTSDMGLKSLAKWAHFTWRAADAGGDQSTVWYQGATEGNKKAQKKLVEYNEDDVEATYYLRNWLTRLSDSGNENGIKSIADRATTKTYERKRRARV